MKQKGIRISHLFACIFAAMAVILALFGIQINRANQRAREQALIEENRRLCENESQTLADGSDYLTNEAWRFVATRDAVHLENYWREVRETRSRDGAIKRLRALSLTPQEEALIERAKDASDGLIAGETWAMRLTADSMGLPPDSLPAEVAAVRYTDGEDSLSPAEKQDLAVRYIFGGEYTAVKEEITGSIDSFRRLLRERKNAEVAACAARTAEALLAVRWLMAALSIAFLLQAALFWAFVLRPLSRYANALRRSRAQDFAALSPAGAHETRALAEAFNEIHAQWQEQRRSLEEERYRFHVALETSSAVVFDYDAAGDVYTAYGSLGGGGGEGPQPERRIERFLASRAGELFGEEGLERLRAMREGTDCSPVELQARVGAGLPVWVRVTATPVRDENRRLLRLIGRVTNIQAEKEKEDAREQARRRDGLTGLFRREDGIREVRRALSERPAGEEYTLMLLDLDDFGRINEAESAVFADAVLQNVADILRAAAGPDDILTRLGGDEFMLLLRGRAGETGERIARRIARLSGRGNPELVLSASIGYCGTSVTGDYSALYRAAESTLKYVKEHGKGRAVCYLDASNELGTLLTQAYPERHRINDIDRSAAAREDLTSFALDLLGKSKNLDDAVYLLLSRVGRSTGVDRILIVERDAEYLICRIVCQWARTPADRKPAEPYYVTREKLDEIVAAYDGEGLCDRRFATPPCGMKSILQAAIWNYGACTGAMSFERRDEHVWTPQERQLLGELTQIISSFTLKARADAVSRAKTDFLSRMSHEIRTPMNAINGMTAIAKATLGNPEKTLDCLTKIESANEYLLSLINDVLDMSRIESGKLELHAAPLSVDALAQNADTLIRPQAQAKGLRFQVENGFAGRPSVLADELRLGQVLLNLLGNAVKFTPAGGSVTLAIEPQEEEADTAVLRFRVTDTGIGIAREAQKRIFGAFEQAERGTASAYGGTGLGLAISSRLVQLMGGALEVESAPHKGASFFFTLRLRRAPAAPGAAGESPAGGPAADDFDARGKRLLLVEDNALNREIAEEILQMNGFLVETAGDGLEAVNRFGGAAPGRYDAILMDIRMPVMDGIEAARRIRTLGKPDSRSVPIIAMTANAFDDDMKKSIESGMDGHLSKPIDVAALLAALRGAIGRREAGARRQCQDLTLPDVGASLSVGSAAAQNDKEGRKEN